MRNKVISVVKSVLSALFGLFIICDVYAALPATLPSGYTQVEWLEGGATSGAYIDLGYAGTLTMQTLLVASLNNVTSSDAILFGSTDSVGFMNGSPYAADFFASKVMLPIGKYVSGTGAIFTVTQEMSSGTVYNIKMNYPALGQFCIDDNCITATPESPVSSKNLYLFGLHSGDGYSTQYSAKAMRVYSLTNWDNGVKIHDFVPARNSSGVLGMYDLMDNNPATAFHTNQGTGAFTGGPVVNTCPNGEILQTYTSATGTVTQNGTPTPDAPIYPTFYTQGNMVLRKVGNIADSYDASTGKITRRVGVKVLNGTETWNVDTESFGAAFTFTPVPGAKGGVSNPPMCSHFKTNYTTGTSNISNLHIGWSANGNSWIGFRDDSIQQRNDWKSYLVQQAANGTPVTVWYPLTTPVEEDWAATQCVAPIKIATTKYNNTAFQPVLTALNNAVTTIKDVVANTITQATAVANLQSGKQTMPDSTATNGTCPNYKQCLLVEDQAGTPHWYVITDPFRDYVTPIIVNNVNGYDYIGNAGYTQVEYLQSDGASYIDTLFTPGVNDKLSVEFDTYANRIKGSNICGVAPSEWTGNGGWQLGFAGSGGANSWNQRMVSSAVYYATFGMVVNQWYHFRADDTGYYVDGVRKQVLGEARPTTANYLGHFYVFRTNVTRSSSTYNDFNGRLKNFKLWQNDFLIRNLVTVRRNSDNALGMYDTVYGVFYPNAGTGTFTAGPDVANPNPALPTTPTWETVWAEDANNGIAPGSVYGIAKCNNSSSDATSTTSGSNCWCRVTSVATGGTTTNVDGAWAFRTGSGWTNSCVAECATSCAAGVYNNATFRRSVFGF